MAPLGDDILANMQSVEERPILAPGDLSALADVAKRLAKGNATEAEKENEGIATPLQQADANNDVKHAPRRPIEAQAALPCDLHFTVPKNCRAGHPVCVQGPHGPLTFHLPQGYQSGERCSFRFGPPAQQLLAVPEGGKAGDVMTFEGADGEALAAQVPPGLEPGDVFEITAPVMMVQVPEGVECGDEVAFTAPDGTVRCTVVPKGVKKDQYFCAQI